MKSPLKVIRKEYPKIRFRIKGNTTYYEVDCRARGKWDGQSFFSFPTKDEAIQKAQEVAKSVSEHGRSGIHHEDVKLLARMRRKLVPFHMGIEEAVEEFVRYRANTVAVQKTELMSTVCELYIESKKSPLKPLRKDTIRGIKATCNTLNKSFKDTPIGAIQKEDVEKALEGMDITNSSRKDYLGRFKSFFKWAKHEKYIRSNPCEGIKVYGRKGDTLILDNESIVKLLYNLSEEPALIPYITLCLFAGIRPTECVQLKWDDIHLHEEKRQIYISQHVSKVHTDRYTPISDNLVEWLNSCVGKPIKIKNLRKTIDRVKTGLVWQKDIMRHTAISYFMGKFKNIYEVSEQLGNQPSIIKKHYQKAVLQKDTDFFWSLTPYKVKALVEERLKKAVDGIDEADSKS